VDRVEAVNVAEHDGREGSTPTAYDYFVTLKVTGR